MAAARDRPFHIYIFLACRPPHRPCARSYKKCRLRQVARVYASIVATSIVTPRAVLRELTRGAAGAALVAIARRRTLEAAEPAALLRGDGEDEDGGGRCAAGPAGAAAGGYLSRVGKGVDY